MRGQQKPTIDAALLEIVLHEVRAFTGLSPLRKGECGKQGAFIDDYISAGNEALIRAVEGFDPSRGVKFKTYASKCVRNAIWGEKPRDADALSHELVRLDATSTVGDERTTHHEVVVDDTSDGFPIPEAAWRLLHQSMSGRDFEVLLFWCVGFTNRDTAKRLSVSSERVRQILERALNTAKELYRVNPEVRLACNAPDFYLEQMADAQSAAQASRKLRVKILRVPRQEIEATASEICRQQVDVAEAADALLMAAKLAMIELGIKPRKRLMRRSLRKYEIPTQRRTSNVRKATSRRRTDPERPEAAVRQRGSSSNDFQIGCDQNGSRSVS